MSQKIVSLKWNNFHINLVSNLNEEFLNNARELKMKQLADADITENNIKVEEHRERNTKNKSIKNLTNFENPTNHENVAEYDNSNKSVSSNFTLDTSRNTHDRKEMSQTRVFLKWNDYFIHLVSSLNEEFLDIARDLQIKQLANTDITENSIKGEEQSARDNKQEIIENLTILDT